MDVVSKNKNEEEQKKEEKKKEKEEKKEEEKVEQANNETSDGVKKEQTKEKKEKEEGKEEEDEKEDEEMNEDLQTRMTLEDLMKMRSDLEIELASWKEREGPQAIAQAEEMWNKFVQVTNEHSVALCEQIRLILLPTLATKLKGDYKTGKRINMKKVIGYIASQFKKDKIWMRRSRPAERNFRILMAIDDSSSMKENQSGLIAMESLVLISRALSRLQIGQVAMAKFGGTVDLLHPFDMPFTDQSGPQVIRRFSFDQGSTDLPLLLHQVLQIFEMSPTRSSGPKMENQDLIFIISDGRLNQRASLDKLILDTSSRGIFVVFIIIDNPKSKGSILDIQTVKYVGKQMKIESYIDEFPFKYYIILQQIHNLPDVLADALRQWLELIMLKSN
eukprot:TRINITY_DN2518_c0_g1_i5.p1 TRINITY_DN2518_c0_g1~~TRINITY_DN2518_c0_g1_i5.p1  ORF type:complete len:437 (+),score=154.13 TRINITY_DN2518_c0_g1_i5:146-1312(+)